MTIEEAIEVLELHNQWRKGADIPMETPVRIGMAIDLVVCELKNLRTADVSGQLPIEEVALHAADDWFDTAKFRSDVKADLKSYYEGYRDAMRFRQGNDR